MFSSYSLVYENLNNNKDIFYERNIHWWTYIFVRQDLSKMFELFQLIVQQISETSDTPFESPCKELLELRKKLGVASP